MKTSTTPETTLPTLTQIEAYAEAAKAGSVPVLTFKGFKTCRGMEGPAWSADLYIDGEPAARVRNEGSGGPTELDWSLSVNGTRSESAQSRKLDEYARRVPAWLWSGFAMTADAELLVAEAAEEFMEAKDIVKKCAKHVPFQTEAQRAAHTWGLLSGPFTVAAKAKILAEYGPCRFAHEVFLRQKPLDLPIEADGWLRLVLKGQIVLKHNGLWMGFKAVDTPVTRTTLLAKYPGAVFLNDLYAAAVQAAKPATATGAKPRRRTVA